MSAELSLAEINKFLQSLDKFSEEEQHQLLETVEELHRRNHVKKCTEDLIAFCCHMMPEYIVGIHHRKLASLLMSLETRSIDRACVSIAPRHGKSQLVSTLYIAWYLGKNPSHQVMLASHTTDLAVDFGRKIRNLVASELYREIFPNVSLAIDSKSAGRWNTNAGGVFNAVGVGSAIAGKGAHLLVIDDPTSEQDILNGNYSAFDTAYDWYLFGARTRLMPSGAVIVVATRWHQDDVIGRIVKDMVQNPKADQFEVFEFPAIMEIQNDLTGEITEKALWPEFFDLEALHRTKATMPLFQWNAQYQQQPTAEEAAMIKREWWKQWTKEKPPKCSYIMMALDAAAETHNRADYTAISTFGVFFNEQDNCNNLILLNCIKTRVEFTELKMLAKKQYNEWQPDCFIVEKKSNGVALFQELRRTGMIIQEYTPHRGSGDKTARLNSVADIVKAGLVWVPQTRWAEEMVEEVAAFPFAKHDDLVDTLALILARFRQGGFITLPSDQNDDSDIYAPRRGGYYV